MLYIDGGKLKGEGVAWTIELEGRRREAERRRLYGDQRGAEASRVPVSRNEGTKGRTPSQPGVAHGAAASLMPVGDGSPALDFLSHPESHILGSRFEF